MKTTIKGRRFSAVALLAGSFAVQSAQAAIIFSDGFDTDSTSTVLDFDAFNHWTVSDGTVDYLRSGAYGIDCAGGSGGCVDMDGSSGDAGRLTSNTVFDFDARDAAFYTLSVDLSGNQRGGASDTVLFGITIGILGGPQAVIPLDPFEPFANYSFSFDFGAAASGRIIVEGLGGDAFGGILDNVALSETRVGQLPEPATLGLFALMLTGIAATGRKGR